jgi:GT2 family glycosyltransferase
VVHAGGWIDPRTGDGGNITCRLDEFRDVREALFVTFGCAYIKRSVVDRLGPLDERYFAYCEDSDYCLQAREAGFRVLMDGRVNLLHSEGASGRANGVDLAALHRASGRQFWEKWGDKLRAVCPPVQSKDGPDREPLLA